MAIDTGKILTISAADYFEIIDQSPSNYTPVGVQAYGNFSNIKEKFANEVPDRAEVVVKYNTTMGTSPSYGLTVYATGTALIPKGKSLEDKSGGNL